MTPPAGASSSAHHDSPATSPATPSAIFEAFCAAGLWPGVGPALIAEMTAAGITRADAVTEEALAALPTVTAKRASRLFTAWVGAGSTFDVAVVLASRGLPLRWARRLIDVHGDGAATLLAADPWQLLAITEASIADADGLARALQPDVSAFDPRRGRAIVSRVLALEARNGHTLTPQEVVAEQLRQHHFVDAATVDGAIEAAVTAGLVRRIGDDLSPETLAAAEDDIARSLRRLAAAARPLGAAKGTKAPKKSTKTDPVAADVGDLDETQRSAVEAVTRHGVSILTGGPGTGKSRTIAAVVALGRRLGLEIALAAPTGRAAKRLTELVSEGSGENSEATDQDTATTIHRLLGARPVDAAGRSGFEYDADNQLGADIVVIDEASMVDAELGAALLRAIPSGAHLLLVGDPAQLPSIGAGRVLGDLLEADAFPTTELTTLYRQSEGGAIARLAASVRQGELTAPDGAGHEVVVVPESSSARAAHRVVQLVTDSIPRVFGLEPGQIQVVTPVHRGPAGTEELNRVLKATLNPGPHSHTVRGFDAGDRVVATANYLDARPFGYANGEIGTVIDTDRKSVLVAFPGGDAEVTGKALSDLTHGWAVTVHRAQGSEWEAVVAVLPPEAGRMLSRPLIYTALTRAKRHLSIVHAAGPAVAHAVRTIGARPRRTRLTSLLSSSAAADPARESRTPAPR